MNIQATNHMEPEPVNHFDTLHNAKNSLSRFTFNIGPNLRNIDLSYFVLPLARNYEGIVPIQDESISIYYPPGQADTIHVATIETLAMILQSGTMVMDALIYMGVLRSNLLDTHGTIFSFIERNGGSIENQVKSVSLLTAAVIILYTRGSLPGSNMTSSGQTLPKFVAAMSGLSDYETEGELRDAIMSFDPKHVNLSMLMAGDLYGGWDSIVANRINLGVAGHKPLKAIADLWTQIPDASKGPLTLIGRLKSKYDALNGGFYLALHPAYGTVAARYNKFYLNCMRAIFDVLPGINNVKYDIMVGLQYLSKDSTIVNHRLHRFAATYDSWNFEIWDEAFGVVTRFDSEDREHIGGNAIGLLVNPELEVADEVVEEQ